MFYCIVEWSSPGQEIVDRQSRDLIPIMTSPSYTDRRQMEMVAGLGCGVIPVRKGGSSTLRFPVISVDGIQSVLEPDNTEMKHVLAWVDEIIFSRPKKHLHRDFSDGVMMAELICNFVPKFVELHNYVAANALPAKKNNWRTLNRRVFSKLEFTLSDALIEFLAASKPGAVELVLKHVHEKIMNILEARARFAEESEVRLRSGDDLGFGEGSYRELLCKAYGENLDYVMCSGNKFVNQKVVEEKSSKIIDLEQEIKELKNKTRRLETLVNLKDERLCALTMELHQAHQKATGSASSPNCRKSMNNFNNN